MIATGTKKSPRLREWAAAAPGLIKMLDGIHPATPGSAAQGCSAGSGKPGAFFRLTRGGYSFNLKAPNCDSHTWRLVPTPIGAKVHAATASIALDGLADIGGAQRPYVREATAAYHRPGSVVCPAFPFKPLNCEVSMNTQTPNPITLPAFRVDGANILPADGVSAMFDACNALLDAEQAAKGADHDE